MKNLFYSLGLTFFLLGFSLFSTVQINAQSVDCDWVADSSGCDVYDCGSCIMWACGSSGGMLIFDEEEED